MRVYWSLRKLRLSTRRAPRPRHWNRGHKWRTVSMQGEHASSRKVIHEYLFQSWLQATRCLERCEGAKALFEQASGRQSPQRPLLSLAACMPGKLLGATCTTRVHSAAPALVCTGLVCLRGDHSNVLWATESLGLVAMGAVVAHPQAHCWRCKIEMPYVFFATPGGSAIRQGNSVLHIGSLVLKQLPCDLLSLGCTTKHNRRGRQGPSSHSHAQAHTARAHETEHHSRGTRGAGTQSSSPENVHPSIMFASCADSSIPDNSPVLDMISAQDTKRTKTSYATPLSSRCPERPLSSLLSPISPNVPMHPHSSGHLQSPQQSGCGAVGNFDFELPFDKAQGTAAAWSDDSTDMPLPPISMAPSTEASDPFEIKHLATSNPSITFDPAVAMSADRLCWQLVSTLSATCQTTVTQKSAPGYIPVTGAPSTTLDTAREWLAFMQKALGNCAHEVLHTATGLQRLTHAVQKLQQHASRRQSDLFLYKSEAICSQYVHMTSSQLQPLQCAICVLKEQLGELHRESCGHRDAVFAMQAQGAKATAEREQLVMENQELKVALEHAQQQVRPFVSLEDYRRLVSPACLVRRTCL
jgi:hypothetical protein